MNVSNGEEARIAQEAAAMWLVRLEEEGEDRQCREEFVAWVRSSPRNLEEFLFAQAVWKSMAGVDPRREIDVASISADEENIVSLPADAQAAGEGSFSSALRTVRAHRRGWLTAVAVAVGVVGLGWLALTPNGDASKLHVTAVGEIRAVPLSDGSVMHLNTNSRAEVDFSDDQREVRLLEGEALFVVAKDAARRFRVRAGETVVEAVGTQFDAYRKAQSVRVAVLEGAVSVAIEGVDPEVSATLSAGEQALVANGGITRERVNPQRLTAWRDRQLDFRGEPLARVAEEFNRYSETQIHVDETASNRAINGVFDALDVESFLRFLEGQGIVVNRRAEGIEVSSR